MNLMIATGERAKVHGAWEILHDDVLPICLLTTEQPLTEKGYPQVQHRAPAILVAGLIPHIFPFAACPADAELAAGQEPLVQRRVKKIRSVFTESCSP